MARYKIGRVKARVYTKQKSSYHGLTIPKIIEGILPLMADTQFDVYVDVDKKSIIYEMVQEGGK